MSYDFALYCQRAQDLPPPPSAQAGQVAIHGPDRLEEEDIDAPVRAIIGRKRILYSLHMEGSFTATEHHAIDAWLGQVIRMTKGVLIDQQTETYETPIASGRLVQADRQPLNSGKSRLTDIVKNTIWKMAGRRPQAKEQSDQSQRQRGPDRERAPSISFFFADSDAFHDTGFARMLETIAELCPQALPHRYGYWEPLQERVEDDDLSALVAAFRDDTSVFMKAKAPFGHIFISVPCRKTFERYHPKHFLRREFLLSKLSIELRPAVFSDPRQMARVMSMFERLCVDLNVVYAAIRTADHGDTGWRWYGIPEGPTHTICLGPAYRTVWPEAEVKGRNLGPDHLILTTDRFGNTPPAPPDDLIAPAQDGINPGGRPRYAKVFPFDFEYSYDTYHW